MKLRRLVCGDIHFQWKYGFYFIYFVLTVIYVFGITALPDNWKHNAAAIMIYSDPAAMGPVSYTHLTRSISHLRIVFLLRTL